jgi:hypothetical protein
MRSWDVTIMAGWILSFFLYSFCICIFMDISTFEISSHVSQGKMDMLDAAHRHCFTQFRSQDLEASTTTTCTASASHKTEHAIFISSLDHYRQSILQLSNIH